MFLYGGATIVMGLIFILILGEGILKNSFYFPSDALGLVIMFPIFLNLAMWFNFGFEKIIFTNNRLEIIKSNRIFSIKKTINICEAEVFVTIKNKRNTVESLLGMNEMRRAMYFWWKMGQLILKTKNKKLTILNGLQENEVVKMKILIEKEIEQRCS